MIISETLVSCFSYSNISCVNLCLVRLKRPSIISIHLFSWQCLVSHTNTYSVTLINLFPHQQQISITEGSSNLISLTTLEEKTNYTMYSFVPLCLILIISMVPWGIPCSLLVWKLLNINFTMKIFLYFERDLINWSGNIILVDEISCCVLEHIWKYKLDKETCLLFYRSIHLIFNDKLLTTWSNIRLNMIFMLCHNKSKYETFHTS